MTKAKKENNPATNEIVSVENLGDNKIVAQDTNIATFNAEAIISQAVSQNVPVETMERLLAMRRELKAEFAKEAFDKAMAAFQADCPTIQKTKEVKTDSGARAYRYAPIESIVEQVKTYLQRHGFSYSSNMELIENGTTKVKASIKVTHSLGHSEITDMTVPLGSKTRVMSDTQVVAAAQTFAKRYAFCNAFGILTGDEDTDARPVEVKQDPNEAYSVKSNNPIATPAQKQFIANLLNQKGITNNQLKELVITYPTPSALIDYLKGLSSFSRKEELPIIQAEEPEYDQVPVKSYPIKNGPAPINQSWPTDPVKTDFKAKMTALKDK